MGVLNDYFRAVNDEDAARVRSMAGPTAEPGFDAVDAKGVDHSVVLGQLIALARSVEWTPDLCDGQLVAAASDVENGPWVVRLGDDVRDTLADLAPESLPALAQRWAATEELLGTPADELRVVLEQLRALASRARDAGDALYEWCSL